MREDHPLRFIMRFGPPLAKQTKGTEFIKTQLGTVLSAELWQLSLIRLCFNFPISQADAPDISQKAPLSGDKEIHKWLIEKGNADKSDEIMLITEVTPDISTGSIFTHVSREDNQS